MKNYSTLFEPLLSAAYKRRLRLFITGCCLSLLPGLVNATNRPNNTTIEDACSPLSTLPCSQLPVSLPYSLSFDAPVANTLTDQNNQGTGFTLAVPYSGTRLAEDGTPSNATVPGYEPGKLTLTNGNLQIVTNKGFAFTTSNNQLNTLAVQVDSRNKLQVETTLINPYNGTGAQQGGVWVGLSDKTYIKLVVSANKVELRREVNDASASGDQRITGVISGLNTQTVRLRLVIDPATNTAEAFYSTDGTTYLNVGATYTTKTVTLANMGLTANSVYAGIFASHRNGTTPITYSFADFAVYGSTPPPVVQQTLTFSPVRLNYTATQGNAVTSQNTVLTANQGTPAVTLTKLTTADWLTLPAGQTGTLTFGPGQINTNLAPNTYSASVIAQAAGYQPDTLLIQLTVNPVTPPANQIKINFQTASSATPSGYIADTGLPFDNTRGFGWIDPTTAQPKDNTANTRLRNTKDDLTLRTIAFLQAASPANWEYKIENGTYNVTVSAGDPSYFDSNHRLNIEGVAAISNFVPTTTQKFQSGTVTVDVKDGKLTIDAVGGTNSKINYVLISPASSTSDNIAPTVAVKLTGTLQSEGVYKNEVVVSVQASDNGSSGLDSVYYSINNAPYTSYLSAFKLTEAGSYTIRAKAIDKNKNVTITDNNSFQIVKSGPSNAYMLIENLDKFPANDRLNFSLIQIPWRRTSPEVTPYNANHNRVKLKITNKGAGALVITNFTFSNPNAWKIDSIDHVAYNATTHLPLTLAKDSTAVLEVLFMAKNLGTAVTLLKDTLFISSNDDFQPYKKIKLQGLWQYKGEGVNEPDAQQIIHAFGYKSVTAYGHNDGTIQGRSIVPNSDEVEASYFVPANTSKPVYVIQMAAYHGCCASTERVQWYDKSTGTVKNLFTHEALDGQTLLPRKMASNALASGTFTSTAAFGFRIGGYYSDRTKNPEQRLSMRFWKVRDENGNIIPDTYILGQDYINNPGVTNYDYQDNMYFISNIRLENGPLNVSSLAVAPSNLSFEAVTTGQTKSLPLQLTNEGQTYPDGKSDPAIQISAVEIVGPNAGEFSASMPSSTTLAAKASTSATVTFKPTSRGLKNAALLVHYNSGSSPLRIPLYGTANDASTTINVVKRIKGGSDVNMTINNITWEADKNYRKGSIKLDKQVVAGPIAATDEDILYQTYLSAATNLAETRYEVPLSNGTYMLRMHFVENYYDGPAGSRVFNISLENTLRLSSFDIYREVGYRAALVKDFEVTVNDGMLNVKFNPTANRVAIAALEIYKPSAGIITSVQDSNATLVSDEITPFLRVYPNPSQRGESLQVELAGFAPNQPVTLTIQDVMGRLVQTKQVTANQSGEAQLALPSAMSAGLYLINAQDALHKAQTKIIVE